MQVGELCDRLQVKYRHARYVCEEGYLPKGVDPNPDKGHHRELGPAQAFWLGIVLKLKQSGVKTPLASQIADFAREGLRTVTQSLNWEWTFDPFNGKLETRHKWFVDIGDLTYVRIATTANPSYRGKTYDFPWSLIGRRQEAADAAPVVIVRVDLSRLGHLLHE